VEENYLGDRLPLSGPAIYRGTNGILTLGRGDLSFTRREGLMTQREYLVNTIPLTAIRSMTIEGGYRKKLIIMTDTMKIPGIPRHEFSVDNPTYWLNAIQTDIIAEIAKQNQPAQPVFTREIIREVVKYPCPYCSSLIEVTLNQCPHCGAPQRR
jgi:hypothetical protein